jgi:hypothetical protein
MKKSEVKEAIKAHIKGLMEAGKEVVITTTDGTSKTASSAEKLRAKQASDNDDVVTYQKRGTTNESINKKSMNKEFLRMQKLAGLITEGQFQKKMEENEEENEEEEFDLNQAYKEAPSEHSYEDVLGIFKSYQDEDILNDFKSEFPEGQPVSKEDYGDFAMKYIDDMHEVMFIQANWIDITDPDIYDKAYL